MGTYCRHTILGMVEGCMAAANEYQKLRTRRRRDHAHLRQFECVVLIMLIVRWFPAK